MSGQIRVNMDVVTRIDKSLESANKTLMSGEASHRSITTNIGRTRGFTFIPNVLVSAQRASNPMNNIIRLMDAERQRIFSIRNSFSQQDTQAATRISQTN
ncbi:MAG: hypothetical protein LBD23_07930 [Oscillospiraceae bacterium]|jgi:uncharacterized protein YukE|nr:hypothetical protein [Oscillospiraceae bacterium]